MVGLIALDLVLGITFSAAAQVTLVLGVPPVHADDFAADLATQDVAQVIQQG